MLVLDEDAKVFTETSLSDLRIRGQRSKKVKLQNVSNDKSKRVNVLVLDEDTKVFTETSLSDLSDKGSKVKKGQITKCVK